jgi:heat-inducible transcriptional repressor
MRGFFLAQHRNQFPAFHQCYSVKIPTLYILQIAAVSYDYLCPIDRNPIKLSSAMINERAQILLKTLVERHISDGQPVGSRALQQYSGLDVSSATIRHVMADLEEIGLVSSPHTSAGRIPTALAYRLFIDTMLVTKPLDSVRVQQMENQLQPDNPSRLITQASNILSELTQFTGVVATAKRDVVTVRQIEFLRLGEKRVLLIIVMPDGEVENRVLSMEKDYTQSQLTEAGNFLNQHYIGCSFLQIRENLRGELRQLHQDMSALMTAALTAGDQAEAKNAEDYVISGEHNLLHVDEISGDMNRLRGLFNLFEQKTELLQLLEAGRKGQGIHIFVGSESGLASLEACSVVTAPYSANGKVIGTLAVVGPKRMNYERVIPIVDITARLLGNALSHY